MKIYLAGAITNNPDYEQQFNKAEDYLTSLGHTVVNPVKPSGFTYKEYIDMGLNELMRCDAIYMLNGWDGSDGANLEYIYAVTVGMKIFQDGERLE